MLARSRNRRVGGVGHRCRAAAGFLAKLGPAASALRAGQAEPDVVNIRYGPHDRNVLDLWKAKPQSGPDSPTPVVIFFHGGAFRTGDKSHVPARLVEKCLDAGISVASANYRLSGTAPFPAPMLDGARAIQFVRKNAERAGDRPERGSPPPAARPAQASRFGSGFMTTWPIPRATTRSRGSRRA